MPKKYIEKKSKKETLAYEMEANIIEKKEDFKVFNDNRYKFKRILRKQEIERKKLRQNQKEEAEMNAQNTPCIKLKSKTDEPQKSSPKNKPKFVAPLEPNVNRAKKMEFNARTLTAAIALLKLSDEKTDKNPVKLKKAAFLVFEERRLKELKDEHRYAKHAQLKAICLKEWQKSPENPLNSHIRAN